MCCHTLGEFYKLKNIMITSWMFLTLFGICHVKSLHHSAICCYRFNFASIGK